MSSLTAQIARDLRETGVLPGDTLLVHSSLKSLGEVPGGPATVIEALLEAVGSSGTLLMPALSYEHVNGRQPLFDPNWTASCVGAIAETFRTWPGVMRSVHPTHSICAIGRHASDLLVRHHLDVTPVGPNSPLSLMRQVGGKILMLGCGLRPNTSMHGVEELVRPPYLFQRSRVQYVICSRIGQQVVWHYRHDFDGWLQRYDRLEQVMTDGLTTGRVMEAKAFLIDARRMWEAAHAALLRDSFSFVEKLGG